jgi:hypothetical protein
MAASFKTLARLVSLAGVAAPGLVLAHGTDHLHFWGRHTAEGQVWPVALASLAVAAVGWWLWRSRG